MSAVEEGVAEGPVGRELRVEGGRVEGLVMLAPADRSDEALVADQEFRPAEREGDRPALQAGRRLVDRGERRVGDDRPVADVVVESAVAQIAVGAVVADRRHVLRLEQEGEAAEGLRLQLEGRPQRRGERRVIERVVVGLLYAVTEADRDVRVADGLSERRRLLRNVLFVALRNTGRRADGHAQRERNQTLAHDRVGYSGREKSGSRRRPPAVYRPPVGGDLRRCDTSLHSGRRAADPDR